MRPLGTGTRRLIGGLVNQEPYWSKTQLGRPHESLGSASLLQQLHWLSVPERVTFKLCVMVYRCLHGIGPEYLSEDFRLVSEIYSRQATAFCLQYRRRGSCHTPVFTWRPNIPGRRSSSVERATGQCHLCKIFVLIPATPEDIYFPATTTSITLITVSWS